MGKTYLPSNLLNENYTYKFTNGSPYIGVTTNVGCSGTGSNKYCDCYQYNYDLDITSNSFKCQSYITNNTVTVPYSAFTSDVWYRTDIWACLLIFVILFIVIFKYPFKLISRMFGRWLKL